MVEPHSSNFRLITTNFLGVRIFRKFTGGILELQVPTLLTKKILKILTPEKMITLKSKTFRHPKNLCNHPKIWPEDHWSCIAHPSADGMLKSVVIVFLFKHSHWAGADNPLGPKFWWHQEGLITTVICCKFKKYLFNFWLYTHLFMI